jgi:Ca-activated chloride channel family protein
LTSFEFARPEFLYLLLLAPLWWLVVWPWAKGGVLYTSGESPGGHARSWGAAALLIVGLPRILRLGAIASLVVALAHPQLVEVVQETEPRGISLALALDISTSMLADDMEDERTRMAVARESAARFAEGRELDEMSLVAFAGQAVTRVPPTTDPRLIVTGVETLVPQLVLDGTDISAAMLMSLVRLLESDREERVIVLLTDGAHNGAGVAPLVTGRAAAALGVRVHSIALLGEPDLAQLSAPLRASLLARQALVESEIETVLTAISRITGGEYYRASTGPQLDSIYREIANIEAPVDQTVERTFRTSLRVWPLLLALLFIGVDAVVRGSRWGLVP